MKRFTLNTSVCLRAAVTGLAAMVTLAAGATNITVDSLLDPGDGTTCTLRQAISAANTDAVVGTCFAGQAAPIVDVITFSGALALTQATPGTITLDQSSMSEAPASFGVTPNWLLVISTPITITGPGSAALTINGGGLAATAIGRRTLLITDGVGATDMATSISGLSFKEGRSVGASGGCLFSRESLTLTDVRFEGCEAIGSAPSTTVGGGALSVNVASAADAKPNVTLTNVKFIGNRAVHGAAAAANGSCCGAASFGSGATFVGSVSIDGGQFIGNSAESIGALRIVNGTSVTITNTQFVTNTATNGSAGAFNISAISGPVTMNHGGAVGNSASARRGGGVITTVGSAVMAGSDAVSISDWSFIGNFAGADIGGLDILTDTFDQTPGPTFNNCLYAQLKNVRLTNVYFEKNLAAKGSGGLRVLCSGNVALSGVELLFNEVFGLDTPGSGGNSAGQLADVAAVTMDNIRIVGNKTYSGTITPPATQNGGYGVFNIQGPPYAVPAGIYPLAHSFTGSRFLVKDNWVAENEAGLSLRPNAAGTNYSLSDSSFVGNRAKGIAALFLNATGNYTVTNSTFSGNITTGGGPAVFINTHASSGTNSVALSSITSARNGSNTTSLAFGSFNPNGGAATSNASVSVKNAILGQFMFGSGFAPVTAPVMTNVSYAFSKSVVENANGMPAGACGTNGVLCNIDAKLEGLADNGGTVQTYTHALRPGSPALDAGDNAGAPPFDQRGTPFSRPVNATVDIGAFESPVLASVLPCKLDMNGDNQVSALSEGLVLLRAMFGLSGAAAIAGTGITQGQWDAVRNNLNANCGTNFAP